MKPQTRIRDRKGTNSAKRKLETTVTRKGHVTIPAPLAHKTLTVSEEAYNALARLKSKDESFTKVILRLAQKRNKGSLLEYIRSIAPDNELADRLEEVLEERQKIRLGARGR